MVFAARTALPESPPAVIDNSSMVPSPFSFPSHYMRTAVWTVTRHQSLFFDRRLAFASSCLIVPGTSTRAISAAELRSLRSTTPLLCTSSNSFIDQCKYQKFCANASSRRNAPRTPRYQTRLDRLYFHSDDPSLISQPRSVTSNNTPSVPRACSKRHTAETARGTMAFKRPSVHTNLQRLE
jgi:hypothetical protein